ncbi:MAG: enoyl-CoA hydratase, partial [Actinomycetota bacterium]|nr:enoyl-CoA hydratase [Actinomycetota bacterium]
MNDSTEGAVRLERVRPGIALLTLNRPARLNAMNYDLVRGLYDVFDELDADPSYRVVVLTGAGR